jgi:hypothetical protein
MSTVKPFRQWQWGRLPTYNGFCHAERVRGWQLLSWFVDNGWHDEPATCCISGRVDRVAWHSENYYSLAPVALNQAIHFSLHRRFGQPNAWRRIVDQYATTGAEWFARLPLAPVDLAGELRAKHGPDIADIFARAPIPEGVSIPYHQIYRQRECANGN